MMTTVFGTYNNGQITLDEALPVKTGKAKVMVTLVEEVADLLVKPKRELGRLKGSFSDPYWSSKEFNQTLDDFIEHV